MKTALTTLIPVAACVCVAAEPVQEKITMHEGETVTRTLDGNPTTGYLWKAQAQPADSPVKVETALTPRKQPGDCPLCGSPCPTQVTITAQKPGTATVVVDYARPWEKDTPPTKTVQYDITVLPRE